MTREEAMKWLKFCAFSTCEDCENERMPIEYCDRKMQDAVLAIETSALTCKDCKYFREEFGCCTAEQWDLSRTSYPTVDEDGYCSYGERRTDDGR